MKHALTLVCIVLFLSCTKPNRQINEITKVELARSGAWSDFGASISVDTSFDYKYFGDYGNTKQSYFMGKIDSKFWDTLNQKLIQIKYKTLPITDNKNISDATYFELIIHWKKGEKSISRVSEFPPDSVLRVIRWLNDSYKNIKLHEVKDTIRFETIFHMPSPLISQLRFPPPIPKKFKKHKNN